jgi:adenylyltransferase/sulfurtransferase
MAEDRYIRQAILPQIGREGQARLAAAHAVVVGCGALGTYQAQILSRAGVGRLTIVDRDLVERSNLQRQVLFTDADVAAGLPKAVAAERALRAVNPDIEVRGVVDDLHAGNVEALLDGADTVCDGTDNFETRYLVNDWCVRHDVPWVYGGVIGVSGMVMPILPGETACLRCVFESPPAAGSVPTCETAGVLGSAVAVVAGVQATEVLKILSGARQAVARALVTIDAWDVEQRRMAMEGPRPDCPACGLRDFPYLEGRVGSRAARLCGRNAIQLLPRSAEPPPLAAIAERLGGEWEVTWSEHLLSARKGARGDGGYAVHLFRDGRAIVEGTTDEAEARSLYARVVGT